MSSEQESRDRRVADLAERVAGLAEEVAELTRETLAAQPLLGAPVQVGFTVIAAIPMFPGAFDTDYIVAAWRPALEHLMPVFGTWRASRVPPAPWLFEAGKYFTAGDETADAVREAARKAMLSLAERSGAGLCSACGGAVGDVCWRCA